MNVNVMVLHASDFENGAVPEFFDEHEEHEPDETLDYPWLLHSVEGVPFVSSNWYHEMPDVRMIPIIAIDVEAGMATGVDGRRFPYELCLDWDAKYLGSFMGLTHEDDQPLTGVRPMRAEEALAYLEKAAAECGSEEELIARTHRSGIDLHARRLELRLRSMEVSIETMARATKSDIRELEQVLSRELAISLRDAQDVADSATWQTTISYFEHHYGMCSPLLDPEEYRISNILLGYDKDPSQRPPF